MKRFFDLLISFFLIVLTLPFWPIVGLFIKVSIGGSVFFVQKRIGKDCKEFNMIKFSTMRPEDPNLNIVEEQDRLTPITRFLRNTSLDEIPELINVFRGEMSLIGPRPLLPEYLPLYSKVQKRRHKVMPGITGLAQVSGRNQLTWEKKFQYDIYYVRNQSFCLDLVILLKTARSLFNYASVNAGENLSMPRFKGKN